MKYYTKSDGKDPRVIRVDDNGETAWYVFPDGSVSQAPGLAKAIVALAAKGTWRETNEEESETVNTKIVDAGVLKHDLVAALDAMTAERDAMRDERDELKAWKAKVCNVVGK